MSYKPRILQHFLADRPRAFRAVLITGPRRSGKSTLARELLKQWGGKGVLQFDTPADQSRFLQDPEGLLRGLGTPLVLDEVQNVPEVFNYLKKLIDENPEGVCDYILTGSQQFQMMKGVTESLAGRVVIKELLPFACCETEDEGRARAVANLTALINDTDPSFVCGRTIGRAEITGRLVTGGFPPVAVREMASIERDEWFSSYLETYVQRDIRALSSLQNLSQFSRFVHLCALRTAGIINYSEIGKDIGVNYKTAQHYLSLLISSYIWKVLPPFYPSGSEKRITKSPKGLLLDTGLASYLVGASEDSLERHPLYGNLFETFVICELIKLSVVSSKRLQFFHCRVDERREVDLVLEVGNRVIPIEIKASGTVDSSWGRGLVTFKKLVKEAQQGPGFVISLNPDFGQIGPGVYNLPIGCFL